MERWTGMGGGKDGSIRERLAGNARIGRWIAGVLATSARRDVSWGIVRGVAGRGML